MLEVNNLAVRYGSLTILENLSFTLDENQWLMIVGPNGAGKSTLINAVSGAVPGEGSIRFEGADLLTMKSALRARYLGVLMQSHSLSYSFTVEEVVKLGRYAYSGGPFGSGDRDESAKVVAAMAATGVLDLRGQSVLTLSGGEIQRTFLAQLLAQDPRLLILDEPSNHLDLVYQSQVFDLIQDWVKQPGRAVISVVHDLSLARAYGSHAMLLGDGRLHAYGEINRVLTRENLQSVYEMDVYDWMSRMLSQWRDGPQ